MCITRENENLIPFTDDLMFSLVMRDVETCREFLKLVLPNEDFGEIRIASPENPLFAEVSAEASEFDAEHNAEIQSQTVAVSPAPSDSAFQGRITSEAQSAMKFAADMHGVRFDAYIKSDEAWADIEMQTSKNGLSLGKRSRYYQSNMDLDCLEQGQDYEKLKKCYVIFICTFDYFGKDEAIYYFQNWDYEKGLKLDDFSYKIVLNTSCSKDKIPMKLSPLFTYIHEARNIGNSELVDRIDKRVRNFSTGEWRRKQMTFEYYVKDKERRAYHSGEEAGMEIGLERGAAQKEQEIAKQMLAEAMPISAIAKFTKLSIEEIEALQN